MDETRSTIEIVPEAIVEVTKKPEYENFKKLVNKNRKELQTDSSKAIADYLFQLLNEDIYYYWKGTPWDFNGTTQKPREGQIACGYFVTNTLYDLGFKIQRIKLAQAVSSKMIKTLCVDINRFDDFKKLQLFLASQPINSAYIIGLDFHTGFVLKDSAASYFLHANYINRMGVVKEKIEASQALVHNKAFMIGSLTANHKLLEQWIK